MTSIIDYGAGNIQSVKNALEALGEPAVITCDRAQILNADRVILPGVGAFGAAMAQINRRGLADTIRSAVQSGLDCRCCLTAAKKVRASPVFRCFPAIS